MELQQAINKVLLETGVNPEKAAEMLGIGRKTLYRKLRKYGIEQLRCLIFVYHQ